MPSKGVDEKVYAPLVAEVEQRIATEVYPPGSQLPSEATLCDSYNISRVSVRKALAELEDKGLVCRRPGKGTFVQFPGTHGRTAVLAPIGITAPHAPDNPYAHLYLSPLRDHIAQNAFAMGYRVEWLNHRALNDIEKGALSGLICVSWVPELMGSLNPLVERGVPVVLVNRTPPSGTMHAVTIDNRKWASKAVEYLMHLGHREIAFISVAQEHSYLRERWTGYHETLQSAGEPPAAELTVRLESADPHYVGARFEELLSSRKPTALVIGAGVFVAPVLTALHRLGCSIPRDISVIVFDDMPNLLYPIIPALTVVRQPLEELGRRSAALIDRVRRGGSNGGIVETIRAEMVIRESCRAIS